MSLDDKDKALLTELARGAEKAFENAEALYNEATLLCEMGHMSRALFLHQISLEECAKIDILNAFAAGLLIGHEGNLGKLKRFLSKHARKNEANAYFLPGSPEEQAAKQSRDIKGARECGTRAR